MEIIIQTNYDGEQMKLKVASNVSIEKIKTAIRKITEIPVNKQRLTLISGSELEDHLSLSDYKIGDNSRISLDLRLHPRNFLVIFVKNINSCGGVTLRVEPTDSIEKIKTEIFRKEKIPVEDQYLFLDELELENSRTFKFYNIQRNSKILLAEGKIKIIIQMPKGQKIEFKAKPNKLVEDLKEKVEDMEGIPVYMQKLFHEKKLMEDERLLINYCPSYSYSIYIHLKLTK